MTGEECVPPFLSGLGTILHALRATDLDWELARNGGEGAGEMAQLAMIEFSKIFCL